MPTYEIEYRSPRMRGKNAKVHTKRVTASYEEASTRVYFAQKELEKQGYKIIATSKVA